MTYVLIEQDVDEDDEPTLIYSQLDESRREVRRVEFYRNGLSFAYGGERGHEEALAPKPFPEDLRALNRPGEVSAHTITAEVFHAIWNQAQELPDGFMGMFA